MATGVIPARLGSPIPPGFPSPESSPTSDEYEDARTQFRSSRSNSTSSPPEDNNDDPEPPYSLVPPDGEIFYTNYLAHDHSPAPSSEEDVDASALVPIFRTDTWYYLHPSSDASLAIDVINDGRAHIDGNLDLAPAGKFSGQFWNIRPVDSDDPRHAPHLYVLATMYLGPSMVLTAGQPVRLAPYQVDGFDWMYHSQHWQVSKHADGTHTFTAGYGFEGGARAVTLTAWGQGLVLGETDSNETSGHTDSALWRVEPYQTMSERGGFWTPG